MINKSKNHLVEEMLQEKEKQQTQRVKGFMDGHERSCFICRRYMQYLYDTNQSCKSPIIFPPIMKHVYALLSEKK
jgi:hypothetical protein